MAESRALEYKAKLDQLVEQAINMPAEARVAVLSQLRQAADAVAVELAKSDPTSLSAARLRAMRAEVERIMASFAQNAAAEIGKAEGKMYTEAARSVAAVVQVGTGQLAVMPVLNKHVLAVAQGYSADLVTGLSHETATKINGALSRAGLGAMSRQQLVEQIGGALDGGEFSGLFSPTGARASSIATNETLRMHSVASQASMTALAERHTDLEKEWFHLPIARVPRPSHVLANTQSRPVDQPFDVGGEQLMYPRDPSGSADNTIGCHCLMRPKVSKARLQPSDQERAALQRHGISITTHQS